MSRVLIVGGAGFIGRHIAAALVAAGHHVAAVGRAGLNMASFSEAEMVERISGHDVVINAAGLVRSHRANSMEAVHDQGAKRLFQACFRSGVRRLIHISALGASSQAATLYQRSKGLAEDSLKMRNDLDWCVLRPSVVIGGGGASTAVLTALAALPLLPRLGPGTWQVQPVHVDDLAELTVRLVERQGSLPRSLDVVGPKPMTTDAVITALRGWLGLAERPFFPVPEPLLGLLATCGERMMDGPMNRDVLAMLKAGNVSDPQPLARVLGRAPRALSDALARHPAAKADLQHARLFFIRPVLRLSLGFLWVMTGLLSFGLYPIEDSHRMLAQLGLDGLAADALLYGGASLDLGLGLLLLARWRAASVGAAMLASMATFTLIALALPAEYWLHPFAPLLKNLPIAAAVLTMTALEA